MTLTETAKFTKKAFILSGVFLALIIIAWNGYFYWYNNYYLPNLPEVVIPPELKFGNLPKSTFPKSATSSASFTYNLDTTSGDLPKNFPKLANVFFIPQLGATLLAPDRAKELAATLSFTVGPDILSTSRHRFRDSSGGEIIIDLNTNNFQFTKPLPTSEATPSADYALTTLPEENLLISDFKTFLASKNLLKPSFQNGKVLATSNTNKTQATITIWPESLKIGEVEYPILGPKANQGLLTTEVAAIRHIDDRYTKLDYNYWEIDLQNFSTYSLKSVQEAFDDLKNGEGILLSTPVSKNVSITEVYLAYYESETYTPYLQPIFVFQGPNFLAYVEGIIKEQISN